MIFAEIIWTMDLRFVQPVLLVVLLYLWNFIMGQETRRDISYKPITLI
jgi:hypothetical protein